MTKQATVCVIGSINMDLTITTTKMPKQGETVLGGDFATYPGGKGANQAVAAARLGANVHMIGAVGQDEFGTSLLNHLKTEGIHVDGIVSSNEASTGVANIILSEQDNRIIVASGANKTVSPELVDQYQELIKQSDMVLLQLEIPIETVLHTVELASSYGVPVIVNPAPYQELPDALLKGATYVTPNEIEAQAMQEHSGIQSILDKQIITKGEHGVDYIDGGQQFTIPSFQVEVRDTTGAGDTFNGALARSLGEGASLKEAIYKANAAAAISVTKVGAQGGMPTKEEVEKFIKEQNQE
ncbi:ribokinase [Oceanobacillus halotolerans]|uniref:ribokinase n=1 Tax=Oceanobacillus halotolerans TaxID=2663380 RepID=UPI0013D8EE09|nr:ribokinase [Oceanobacillus halotolerans]